MKSILILAAAAIAVPAFAQSTITVRPSVAHAQPACMIDGSCPTLSATISRQLGTPIAQTTPVGGPYEPAMTRSAMTARAAADYPPCSPGPGDDRCIQLYERGVRR
jgi:hypothetical protein